jgi:ABC-type bacteriocin/lantibiotic exporter with double-glycine peptidase domain
MAEDTSLINGAGSESVAPAVEGIFAMITGIAIGMFYSWKLSLTALLISPILMIGSVLDGKLLRGNDEKNASLVKDSTIFMGDCI